MCDVLLRRFREYDDVIEANKSLWSLECGQRDANIALRSPKTTRKSRNKLWRQVNAAFIFIYVFNLAFRKIATTGTIRRMAATSSKTIHSSVQY